MSEGMDATDPEAESGTRAHVGEMTDADALAQVAAALLQIQSPRRDRRAAPMSADDGRDDAWPVWQGPSPQPSITGRADRVEPETSFPPRTLGPTGYRAGVGHERIASFDQHRRRKTPEEIADEAVDLIASQEPDTTAEASPPRRRVALLVLVSVVMVAVIAAGLWLILASDPGVF